MAKRSVTYPNSGKESKLRSTWTWITKTSNCSVSFDDWYSHLYIMQTFSYNLQCERIPLRYDVSSISVPPYVSTKDKVLLFSAAMFVVSVIKLPIKFTLQLPLNNSRNDYVTVTFICPYDESLNVATTSEEFVVSHNLSCINISLGRHVTFV